MLEVKAIVIGKKLRSEEIMYYSIKATCMTGDSSQHSEQNTFIPAIDPEVEDIKSLRVSLQMVIILGEKGQYMVL